MPKSRQEPVEIAGIRLSNPDKILFPEQGLSKRDLATYLERVAPLMLPHIRDRLISLVRCPEGRRKQCFFQRHVGQGLPDAIHGFPLAKKDGKIEQYVYIRDLSGLIAAAQMGVLELHVWGSRIDAIEKPDRIVFDLDPAEDLPFAEVRRAAFWMRDLLDALGLGSFPLLTGGKGIHVVAPITRTHEWPVIKAFAGGLAKRMANDAPDRFVATMTKAKRHGRIFIDFFRNDRSASAIAPFSPRAREGAPVAWPVDWDGLEGIDSGRAVTIASAPDHLAAAEAAWSGYFELRQQLRKSALKAVDAD